ncbi:MAG: HEPN domain-containing protein [Candidatus Aenigmarchaeota archaeon]|nr:HEPN domain-containing protein [Candidatus Aenigmarchaeota archaeon]
MKEFAFFVQNGSVKKQAPDVHTAKATAKDCLERLELAKNILRTQKPKYCLENSYEAIRELIDAVLFLEGYKSFSHEASVSHLQNLGFSFFQVAQVDRLRKQRNGIKYYGEDATQKEAEEAIVLAEKTIKELLRKKPELNHSL